MTGICAIVLAAGRGERMAADKAFLELGAATAIERVVHASRSGGVASIRIVRAAGTRIPRVGEPVVEVAAGGEMLDSVRAGIAAAPEGTTGVLVFPVDFAMVGADTVARVVTAIEAGGAVVLPLCDGRPGHPIGLAAGLFTEVANARATLREVVVAETGRVRVVEVDDPWIHRDLDTPEELAAARAELVRRS